MSCITEILKLKGEKDVFIPLNDKGQPWIAVEGGGKYKDYEFLIVLNKLGHRCGYVAIPPEHKYSQTKESEREMPTGKKYKMYDYDTLDIECHGGLTFMASDHGLKKLLTNPCTDMWIGFDCGHLYDASDYDCLVKYYGEQTDSRKETIALLSEMGTIKKFNYVESECKSIIDQLIQKAV